MRHEEWNGLGMKQEEWNGLGKMNEWAGNETRGEVVWE